MKTDETKLELLLERKKDCSTNPFVLTKEVTKRFRLEYAANMPEVMDIIDAADLLLISHKQVYLYGL